MFLHIGENKMINFKEVIMILDWDAVKNSQITKEYLELAESERLFEKKMENDDHTKSVIITSKKVYFSSISTTTLLKRSCG